MKNIMDWKYEIEVKYILAQKEIKRIRKSLLFQSANHLIDWHSQRGDSVRAAKLHEHLDNETELSKHYMTLQDLHNERLEWLSAYTNNDNVLADTDNQEQYMILSHRLIHGGEYDQQLLYKLMNDKAVTA